MEYMDLNEDSRQEQIKHAETLKKYEAQKRGRTIALPTSIDEVKTRLRQLNHPVTLFGENPADRRERLREIIARLELNQEELSQFQEILNQSSSSSQSKVGPKSNVVEVTQDAKGTTQKEVFYTNATELLIEARRQISVYSFQKTKERIVKLREIQESDTLQVGIDNEAGELYKHSKEMALNASQFGDDRPMTVVRYSHDSNLLATASLSNSVKVWNSSNLECISELRRHTDRVTSVGWHPHLDMLASTSADGLCNVWSNNNNDNEDDNKMDSDENNNNNSSISNKYSLCHQLRGHQGVVGSCLFHSQGSHLITTGHDYSWRMWDLQTGAELLLQDGHVKECCSAALHPDGSLLLTGDAGGVALVWDLRSGQCILPLQGHTKKITSASFSCNGFQVATSSVDNTVKVWDLRKKKCGYTLPAHSNIISDVVFSKSGELLLTSSFDSTLKIWGSRDFQILRTLSGHSGKVMACDFSSDERHISSVGYDRTIKLWAHKDEF